ncbi:hypothetical protein B9Z55_027106 [Caenorhabditis nigoni]|nr:hypothetical protein B9Z55_027106 [Caenorhabditis nigoni]
MFAEDLSTTGYCVELDDKTAKFYTLEHGLVEMDVVEDPPVKTYAITPNVLQLSKDMAKRFRYRVWSPFMKYLNDPEDKSEE